MLAIFRSDISFLLLLGCVVNIPLLTADISTALTYDKKMNSWPRSEILVAIILLLLLIYDANLSAKDVWQSMLAGNLVICVVVLWFEVCSTLSNLVKETKAVKVMM